jgi:hypothetical protein
MPAACASPDPHDDPGADRRHCPVAISVGEGGSSTVRWRCHHRRLITSTLLTLLVIPSFYDSIEINRERLS